MGKNYYHLYNFDRVLTFLIAPLVVTPISEERKTKIMSSKKNEGVALHQSYEPPMADFFSLSAPQDILVDMSIELSVEDFEQGEDL